MELLIDHSLTDETILDTHHHCLHRLLNTAKDLDHILKNTTDHGKDILKILQQLLRLLRLPHETLLVTQHFQSHLTSMKHKVIGDVKTVEIGILLSAHIAIAARSKTLGKQVEITMKEMIGIIIVTIEAQIGNNSMIDTQGERVIMTGDSNMTDRMVEVVDHMVIEIEEIIQGRDRDRMIDTTTAETIVMIEVAIEDRDINKKVV